MIECQRSAFDLPEHLHYLNCAFMAPLSTRVASAGHQALDRLRNPSQLDAEDFFTDGEETRRLFGRLIGAADHTSVAIVPSVSYALATAARNLPVEAGDNIVVLHEQFPSNVYTWRRRCQDAGAELRVVAPPADAEENRGAVWNARILESIDRRTQVVAIPELHWADGTRFDLEPISQRARDCGAALVVDGTQSVGASPFDVARVQPDALVCAGYKWLTGPYGLGLAYLGPRFDDGVPLEENWISRRGSEDFAGLVAYRDDYQPGALRYDVGERSNFILLPMLKTALTQVLEWTPTAVQEYCRALTEPAIVRLRHLGCRIETNDWRHPHLFGIRLPGETERARVAAALGAHRVRVSQRGSSVRVAPHLYNSEADLDALVTAVTDVLEAPGQNP